MAGAGSGRRPLPGRDRIPAPAGRVPARVAAVATAAVSGWHAAMALHHGGSTAGPMLVMAAVCAVCAVHLWTGSTRVTTWGLVVAMDLAMMVAHVAWPAGPAGAHAHRPPGSAPAFGWLWGSEAMVVVPALGVLVTGASAYRTYRAVVLAGGGAGADAGGRRDACGASRA